MKIQSFCMIGIILASTLLFASSVALAQMTQLESKIVVLSPIGRTSITAVASEFQKYIKAKFNVEVTVEHLSAGSPVALARVIEWGGKPDADIFWGGEYQYYPSLTKRGLLEAYIGTEYAQIPSDFQGLPLKDRDGNWIVISFFSPGIMTNKDLLARLKLDEPKTWDDLLKPGYRRQIVMTTPARSGGLHVDVELLLQARGDNAGWAYWRRLAVNADKLAARSLEVSSLVEKGEYALGIAIAETSAVLSKKAGFNVGFVYPDPSIFVPSAIAMLKGAPRPNLAKEFMNFVLTKDAQIAALKGGLVPARPDVKFSELKDIPDAGILREFMRSDNVYGVPVKNFNMNFDLSEQRFDAVNNAFEDTIAKKFDLLKSAWFSIEDVQKTVQNYVKQFLDFKDRGYDISGASAKLAEAESKLKDATAAFDAGDYDKALSLSKDAASAANSSVALLQAPTPPQPVRYDLYLAAAIVIILVAFAAYYTRSNAKKKASAQTP